MVTYYRSVVAFVAIEFFIGAGCGSPAATPVAKGPPPPPPVAPVVIEKPAPPPPEKPKPDPFETAMTEASGILKRYGGIYAGVKNEATADKAVEEIGRMTTRLRDLAAEISKLPQRAGQEKHALALQNDLVQLQSAQLTNPDMQRVMGDPDLGLKLISAHQSFVTEGILPLGQAVVSRQLGGLPQAADPQPTPGANSPKP